MTLPVSRCRPSLTEAQQPDLSQVARAKPGCGILAADETPKAMEIRFAYLKISNTPEVMRCWISQTELNISSDETELPAVILQHETLQQRTDEGQSFIDVVKSLRMIPGVTVDKGWVGLA